MARLNGVAVAAIAAGGLLIYAGARGFSVPAAAQNIIQGNSPAAGQAPSVLASAAAPGAGQAIAGDALRYAGHPYLFGGAPGPAGTAPWDCSSFCNWVLGHDLNLTLPGSSSPGYNGASHGPTTLSYLGWAAASTIGHASSSAAAGDLCVWQTHMGIAIGGGQMISALDAAEGTRVTPIDGQVPGEVLFVRRIGGTP